jgi:hypothetical protein
MEKSIIHTISNITVGCISLFSGGIIYVIYRTRDLKMFEWFDKIGFSDSVSRLRFSYADISIPGWMEYNLPAALWLFSYMLIIDSIWDGSKQRLQYRLFIVFLPLIAIFSEILQYFDIVPGTFDWLDILTYIMSLILFYLFKRIHL